MVVVLMGSIRGGGKGRQVHKWEKSGILEASAPQEIGIALLANPREPSFRAGLWGLVRILS